PCSPTYPLSVSSAVGAHPLFSSPLTPPPHPHSTLFPYTTLFRSRLLPRRYGGARGVQGRRLRRPCGELVEELGDGVRRRPVLRRDRKSTRLNSSHDQISYAVFCLKKKKHYVLQHCRGAEESDMAG